MWRFNVLFRCKELGESKGNVVRGGKDIEGFLVDSSRLCLKYNVILSVILVFGCC